VGAASSREKTHTTCKVRGRMPLPQIGMQAFFLKCEICIMIKYEKGSKSLRIGRASIPGQYYVITTNSHNRSKIFMNKKAAQIVLDSLLWLNQVNRIDLQAAVVMPEHLHFVAGLQTATLPEVMHSLKSFTSKQIKAVLNFPDSVWQSQYHDHAVRKDEVLMDLILYCLQNPVRAGIVRDVHDYPYWYCKFNV
jgi:REP element-mobilizing transposase RayT